MRVVLDTNQLVAALVRPPELATLLMAWESPRFVPIASPALIDEYQHALAYPEIAAMVYPELKRAFESHLLEDVEIVMPRRRRVSVEIQTMTRLSLRRSMGWQTMSSLSIRTCWISRSSHIWKSGV